MLGSQAFDLGVGSEGEVVGKGRGESLRLWEMKLMIRTRRTRLGNPDLDFEIRISDFAIEHEIRISKCTVNPDFPIQRNPRACP